MDEGAAAEIAGSSEARPPPSSYPPSMAPCPCSREGEGDGAGMGSEGGRGAGGSALRREEGGPAAPLLRSPVREGVAERQRRHARAREWV